MKTKNEITGMLGILVSVPGMEDTVKINLSLQRKQVMLLSNVIREGMKTDQGMVGDLLAVLDPECSKELVRISADLDEKAGLSDLQQKVKQFSEH
ncbi:hypothetical protein [Sphingobacterium detergens]|uniref:Uncharacterized protein n=1 Tax=Sphingobacterium detergens TaxID=1145106 RepID=A0A420ARM9_SPHD1|nr:hypothetical protein [Sphingobacterium detergens]RKE47139.1 hypothetical protein DFQ12_4300 [Sphingobacterium detergens]